MQNQRIQHGILITAILLCMAAVGVAHLNTLTYVSGQDPFMYLRLANRMASAGTVGAALQHLKDAPFLPVYPALLAGSIKLFGPFAPYWFNMALFMCLVPVLGFLLRFLLRDIWAAVIALLAVCLLLLGGYPLNAHFLLYPFRELPAMLFMVAGMACFYRGSESKYRGLWLMVGAGICFILAILMREPSVFAVAGPVCWLLFGFQAPGREKAQRLLWFALPWLVAFLVWSCFVMLTGKMVSPQFTSWSRILLTLGPVNLARQFGVNARAMLGFFPDEFGWILLALTILGIWRERRNTRLLSAFLVPALLFFVFYAFYEAHRRYFLNVVIFSAVFAGPGIMLAVDAARRGLPRPVRVWLPVLPVVVLTVCLGHAVGRLHPWGPSVSMKQARQFRETLSATARAGDVVFIDPRCRYMVDAVVSLTDLNVAHPRASARVVHTGGHYLYAAPLNEACFYRGDALRKYDGVNGGALIRHFADMRACKTEEGIPMDVAIGEARFRLYQVTPWITRRIIKPLSCSSPSNRVMWLDFGNPAAACARTVRLLDPAFREQQVWEGIHTGGLHAFVLPDAPTDNAVGHVEVFSECPLPSDFLVGCVSDGEFMEWPLDADRAVSVQACFQAPFLPVDTDDKYAAVFNRGGAIHLPPVHSPGPYRMEVRLIKRVGKPMPREARITFEHYGAILVDKSISLDGSRTWSLLQLPPTDEQEQALALAVDPPDCHGNFLRIEEMAIAIKRGE
ncbi:MAG: hypothetical protein EOM20_19135 [Spartobacteria bacterium]|nr:hypothetical protein [Spartobacteria bacterium]